MSLNNIHQFTYSPWIYYELSLLQFIRKKISRSRIAEGEMRKSFSMGAENLAMAFPVDIKNLYKLSMTELSRWEMGVPSDEKLFHAGCILVEIFFRIFTPILHYFSRLCF